MPKKSASSSSHLSSSSFRASVTSSSHTESGAESRARGQNSLLFTHGVQGGVYDGGWQHRLVFKEGSRRAVHSRWRRGRWGPGRRWGPGSQVSHRAQQGLRGKGGALPNPVIPHWHCCSIHLLQLHWHPAIVNMTVKGSQDWGKEGNIYFWGQQIPLFWVIYSTVTIHKHFWILNYLVCTKHNTPELLL